MRCGFCREAKRYKYPKSVISMFPWRKIAKKVRWGQELKNTEFRNVQRCLRGNSGMIRAVSEGFNGYQLCLEKINAETALIQSWFFALNFWFFSAVSEKISALQLFQRKSALKQLWFSADFLLWKFGVSALFQRKLALFQRKSALKQLWFSADFFALKIPSFRAVSEKIRAVQLWFLALKISVFSAVQSWISAVQRVSGNEQRWKQTWKYSESELISAECLWDVKPGILQIIKV